jgi:hypothetical protein
MRPERLVQPGRVQRGPEPPVHDRGIRNYVGVLRAVFNFARDKRRRWTASDPVADIELPRAPTCAEIRYLAAASEPVP